MRVVDDFFENPYEVRALALKGKYYRAPDLTWPGHRSDVPNFFRKNYELTIQSLVDEKVVIARSYFQWIDKSWQEGVCHSDGEDRYTVITFLNLDPPSNSGTEVYEGEYYRKPGSPATQLNNRVKESLDTLEPFKRGFHKSSKTWRDKIVYNRKSKKHNSFFSNPCVISNKFNRTLIFDSYRIHRAQTFFGNTIKDSRLTLVSFFVNERRQADEDYDRHLILNKII